MREKIFRNGFIRFLWAYLASVDMVITYFFHVKLPLLRGRIVICDRYVYDAATEIEASLATGDNLNRRAIKLMLSLTPRPDAHYLLDLPEEVCAQRKDKNTELEYLQQQRRFYSVLADRYKLRVKRTDREFGTTADEIIQEVLTSYYNNHKTIIGGFLNRLFPVNSCQTTAIHVREEQ